MKRVLVTGAAGFIGRNCLQSLIARGFEVCAVSSRAIGGTQAGVTWHHGDLLDRSRTRTLISKLRATHLLHLAWYSEHGKYWTAPENYEWVDASLELFRNFVAEGGQRVLGAGTCAEYDWQCECCSENLTPLNPASPYGTCKARLHSLLSSLARDCQSSYTWGRIFFSYGPGEPATRLIPSVIRALLRGEFADCTAGSQIRDFLEVSDVADALVGALDSDVNGPVNIASGEPVALRDLINMVGEKIGRPELVRLGARAMPPGEPQVLLANVDRLRNEVGWKPRIALSDGIDRAISWWREQERTIRSPIA